MPITTIELPHVGESVTEGIIGKWLKQPGDPIEKYEPLVEIVTDKVNMEVPCRKWFHVSNVMAMAGTSQIFLLW